MEEVATEARQKARKVRTRVAKKKAQEKEFWVLRLPDSTIDVPIIYGEDVDPASLFKEASEAILEKEKQKMIHTQDGEEG